MISRESLNIGFIGGGNMSTAIAKGIIKSESHPVSRIWVAGPRLHNLRHWSDMGANVTIDSGELTSICYVIFLGVKPGVLIDVVNDIAKSQKLQKTKVLIVSMLAGTTIYQLHNAFECLPISVSIIRIMPNTPMAVRAGSCLYATDNETTEEECSLLENLLQGCGTVERVPEKLMGSLGVVTACGPAFMYIVIEALADGAVKQGVPRALALRHAAQMVAGSGQMVLESGKHPGLLKDEVCSPGGCTIAGIAALENGNLRATMINAIEAASFKTTEMGKK